MITGLPQGQVHKCVALEICSVLRDREKTLQEVSMTGGLDCVVTGIAHALQSRKERDVPCYWSEGYIRCI